MPGERAPRSRLLTLTPQAPNLRKEITSPKKLSAANVYQCKSKLQLVDYHHASWWSTVKSTWVKAISNNFSLPGQVSAKLCSTNILVRRKQPYWAIFIKHDKEYGQSNHKSQLQISTLSQIFPTIFKLHNFGRRIIQSSRIKRQNTHQPNRLDSSHIQQRKNLHFSGVSIQLYHHS